MEERTEEPSTKTEVRVVPAGPLILKGEVSIELPDGKTVEQASVAFCRCGASESKPFCDGAHKAAGFEG